MPYWSPRTTIEDFINGGPPWRHWRQCKHSSRSRDQQDFEHFGNRPQSNYTTVDSFQRYQALKDTMRRLDASRFPKYMIGAMSVCASNLYDHRLRGLLITHYLNRIPTRIISAGFSFLPMDGHNSAAKASAVRTQTQELLTIPE